MNIKKRIYKKSNIYNKKQKVWYISNIQKI